MSSSKWTFCVCLLKCLLNVSVSEVKTVQPGEDVFLLCQGPGGADIIFVEWIRPDLESKGSVFFFRDDRNYENYQHPSFHGRVELRDPQMKDGDASVILKNVNIKDSGTYECYVRIKGNRSELISIVHLKVKVSGDAAGDTADGGKHGHVALVVVTVLVVVVVIGFMIYRRCRRLNQHNHQCPADEAADHELQDLNPKPEVKLDEEEEEEEEEKPPVET